MKPKTPIRRPLINGGATLCYPQDRVPYLIVRVTPNTLVVRPISYDGIKPTRYINGFPYFDHLFTFNELQTRVYGKPQRAYLRKDGRYYLGGNLLITHEARYRRDYSD